MINFDLLKNFKGIIFDLDNTLYDYDACHSSSLLYCSEIALEKYSISKDDFDKCYYVARKKINTTLNGMAASHSRILYFQTMSEDVFGKTNADFSLEMENAYWSSFIDNMVFFEGAESLLEKIRNHGIKTCILTDLTTQIQTQKWIKLDLGRFMNFLITSEEVGVEKPNSKMFEVALMKLNLNISEVAMIGDNLEKDIKGAEKLGITAFHISQ